MDPSLWRYRLGIWQDVNAMMQRQLEEDTIHMSHVVDSHSLGLDADIDAYRRRSRRSRGSMRYHHPHPHHRQFHPDSWQQGVGNDVFDRLSRDPRTFGIQRDPWQQGVGNDIFDRLSRDPRLFGLQGNRPRADNEIFGRRREPRPYGFQGEQLYENDEIFLRGRDPRPYAFLGHQLHRDQKVFGGLDPWRDRMHHRGHRAIGWGGNDGLGVDEILGRQWGGGGGPGDDGLLGVPALQPGGNGEGGFPGLATPFDAFGEGQGMEMAFGSLRY